MKTWIIPAALAASALTACFDGPPKEEDIQVLLKARIERSGDIKLSQATVSNLNCSQRESRYDCEFDTQTKGTYKKLDGLVPGTIKPNIVDAPYESTKKKVHMSLTKGDKAWMEVPF